MHRQELAAGAISVVCAFVGALGMPFSGRHNALYRREEFVAVLSHMCKAGLTASAAVADTRPAPGPPRVPASQWSWA